jgi:phosphatidylglycerol:prolipoprotein diacylglycerol transferase
VRLSSYILIAALVGARVAYAVVNYKAFAQNLFSFSNNGALQLGGMVMNGGLLLAIITIWVFAHMHRLSALKVMDVIAPSFGLGIFITRLGCFLSGCCYGRATDLPWGVTFPPRSPAGHYQQTKLGGFASIHPTQLYCALFGLAIFFGLLLFERKISAKRNWPDGLTTLLAITSYAAARFFVEFFRYNNDHVGLPLGLTHNQYACLLFLFAGATGIFFLRARFRSMITTAAA